MRCSHYTERTQCEKEATHWLRCDGKKIPGGWLCQDHTQAVLDEYVTKLAEKHEKWDAIPIDWLTHRRTGPILQGVVHYEHINKDDPQRQEKLEAQREQFGNDAQAGKTICLTDLLISHGF